MTSHALLQAQRQKFRANRIQAQLLKHRKQIQKLRMQDPHIYIGYNQDLSVALKWKDHRAFYNIINDISLQPTYFSHMYQSKVMAIFFWVMELNDQNHQFNKDDDLEESQYMTPKQKEWRKQKLEHKQSRYYIDNFTLAQEIISRIIYILAHSIYDTVEGIQDVIAAIWPKLDNTQPIINKFTLLVLNKLMKDQPECHKRLLQKGLENKICQFIQEEINDMSLEEYEQSEDNIFVDKIKEVDLSNVHPINKILVEVCYNHLVLLKRTKKQLHPNQQKYWQQKQLSLYFTSNECDFYMRLAMTNILYKKNLNESIQLLSCVIDYAPAYSDMLTKSFIQTLFGHLKTGSFKLKNTVLQFLQTFSIECSDSALNLLHEADSLDFIFNQLKQERQNLNSDAGQSQRISAIGYILCNLFTTKNQHYLKKYHKHPILQYIFEFIQNQHLFAEILVVFEYYFRSFESGNVKEWYGVLEAIVHAMEVLKKEGKVVQVVKRVIINTLEWMEERGEEREREMMEQKMVMLGMEWMLKEES